MWRRVQAGSRGVGECGAAGRGFRPARSGRATEGWLAGREICRPARLKRGDSRVGLGGNFLRSGNHFAGEIFVAKGSYCSGNFIAKGSLRSVKFLLSKFLAIQNKFGVWIVFRSHSDREGEYNNFTERVGLRITLFAKKTIVGFAKR